MSILQRAKMLWLKNPSKAHYKFVIKDWSRLPDLNALSRVLESKRFSQNLAPVVMDYPEGKRILVLAPHPDDDVFGAGGTLLKSIRTGAKVKTVCITTGERGTPHPNPLLSEPEAHPSRRPQGERETPKISPPSVGGVRGGGEGIARIREEETQQVSQAFGGEIAFWQYPARSWRVDETVKERLCAVAKAWNPDTIFLPFLADDHEDHRRTSQLFYEAFHPLLASPIKGEEQIGNSPPLAGGVRGGGKIEIWAYQVYSTVLPNVVVDISDVIEEKLRLVRMHQSQMAHRDWAHYIRGLNAFNVRWLKTSKPRYAETFFVVPAQEYLKLCQVYFQSIKI